MLNMEDSTLKLVGIGLLLALLVFCASGCKKDTNVITPETVKAADDYRIKAIDNDKTMTPEGKKKMKEMLGLVPGRRRKTER